MKKIIFKIYICGMSNKFFSRKIMIYKPHKSVKTKIRLDNDLLNTDFNKLVQKIKYTNSIKNFEKNYFPLDILNWETIYIRQKGTFLSLQSNKKVSDVFNFFKTNKLEIAYFIVGGASINHFGYKFVVHPDESIHINNPHVHVIKDNASVRYSLKTFQRFPKDKYTREYIRDEKKIIIPSLKKNSKELWQHWNYYINGYNPPAIDIKGKEYYKET